MSSEDFKSLVVTDPNLVDPEIDVSGLRTQTDTNPRLLGSIPDLPGIKYDPTSFDYLKDLNELFAFGLPMVETDQAQIPGAIDTLVDTGGGGQATASGTIDTLTTPTNTLEQDRLVDQGIGVQLEPGAPVVAPGEIPITQAEIDAFNAPAMLDSTSTAEDILQDLSNQQAMLNPTGGNIMDEVALTGASPEQQNLINRAFSKVGSTASDIMNDLSQIPGAIADFANQTVDIAGQKINVGKTLLSAGINKIVGGPISLVFDAVGAIAETLPDPISETTNKAREVGLLVGDGTVTQDKYGINTQSLFGDYNQYNLDRVAELETKDNKTPRDIQELEERKNYIEKTGAAGDITPDATPLDIATGNLTGDATVAETIAQQDRNEIQPTDPSLEIPDRGRGDGGGGQDTGPVSTAGQAGPPSQRGGGADMGSVSTAGQAGPPSQRGGGADRGSVSTAGQAGPPSQRGGGGGGSSGGGGKIVCTMMNESYGFGSFRNKIWIKYARDNLSPEHQIGYHKIFLPLVKLSKKNIILKKILEHIAVHRTIDIRQESRGKVHLLGRVYRKILEPICYWVGKHG